MMHTDKKRILRRIICLSIAATITFSYASAYAAPTAEELETRTGDLQDRLNSLNSDLATLVQELDETSAKIEALAAETEVAKLDLAAARLNETAQYDAMKDRIQFMYEGGSISLIEILFESENMADFLNKAEYVTTISDYDRDMLDELITVRNDVEQKKASLEQQQEELAALEEEIAQRQDALNSEIASASSELSDYTEQLERARAAEAALLVAQNNAVSGSVGNDAPSGGESAGGDTVGSAAGTPADTSEVALFAALLQCEAGGSDYEAMLAVATVIMNRVASSRFPDTITDVIYAPNQFSPVRNGKLNSVLAAGPTSVSYAVAQDAIAGARHTSVADCYYFWSASYAASQGRQGITVGGNVFFSVY